MSSLLSFSSSSLSFIILRRRRFFRFLRLLFHLRRLFRRRRFISWLHGAAACQLRRFIFRVTDKQRAKGALFLSSLSLSLSLCFVLSFPFSHFRSSKSRSSL